MVEYKYKDDFASKIWTISPRFDGRTWFEVGTWFSPSGKGGVWLDCGDLFMEFFRWEKPDDEYNMIWLFGFSKFGIGIIGVYKHDINVALKPFDSEKNDVAIAQNWKRATTQEHSYRSLGDGIHLGGFSQTDGVPLQSNRTRRNGPGVPSRNRDQFPETQSIAGRMKDERGREFTPSVIGDIFVILEEVHSMSWIAENDGWGIWLHPGEIVMSMGTRHSDGDMLYLTSHGLVGLPEDAVFYDAETQRLC